MATAGSVAPKERINITYKPATGDAQAEVELLTLPGAGHGFKGADATKAEDAMIQFFDRHLKTR